MISRLGERILGGGGSKQRGGAGSVGDFYKLLNEKKTFLLMVFANLIVQLGITYYTMMNYPVASGSGNAGASGVGKKVEKEAEIPYFWVYVVVQFIIIGVLALVSMPAWMKFILFSVFSFIWGILFASYRNNPLYSGVIKFAVAGTAGIFAAMMAVGVLLLVVGVQLGAGFAAGLFFALLGLIIVELIVLFSGQFSAVYRWLCGFGLFLFSLFIIYDTNAILQRNYAGDFITASMDYYLDIINVFVDLLTLSGGGSR